METVFDTAHLMSALRGSGERWRELLTVPDLSVGIYRLEKGADDPQSPHTEDEIYYVLSGRAWLRVEGDDREVRPGSVAYVPARAEHRFHDIAEDLELLVVFAPAEGSRG